MTRCNALETEDCERPAIWHPVIELGFVPGTVPVSTVLRTVCICSFHMESMSFGDVISDEAFKVIQRIFHGALLPIPVKSLSTLSFAAMQEVS